MVHEYTHLKTCDESDISSVFYNTNNCKKFLKLNLNQENKMLHTVLRISHSTISVKPGRGDTIHANI